MALGTKGIEDVQGIFPLADDTFKIFHLYSLEALPGVTKTCRAANTQHSPCAEEVQENGDCPFLLSRFLADFCSFFCCFSLCNLHGMIY